MVVKGSRRDGEILEKETETKEVFCRVNQLPGAGTAGKSRVLNRSCEAFGGKKGEKQARRMYVGIVYI